MSCNCTISSIRQDSLLGLVPLIAEFYLGPLLFGFLFLGHDHSGNASARCELYIMTLTMFPVLQ